MDQERYYRLRFYFFLGCGAVVSIVYIITLGIAFNLAQERTRMEVRAADRWNRMAMEQSRLAQDRLVAQVKQYSDRNLNINRQIFEHVKNHEKSMDRSDKSVSEMRDVLQRLDRYLKERGG